ncbi:hypothetical protein [Pseudomonas sp. dw_358]|uniref:hypothetical protein n=1 Tax=Pseudomonas sp. dw_358 TaxID=2720083 RepID=UPI001BD33A8F|nr:hypothetical protein [Pseudomonas sp. dw_358]
MVNSPSQTETTAGTADPAFNPSPALKAVNAFELHGLAHCDTSATLYLALSQGNRYALGALDADGSAKPGFGDSGFIIDAFDDTTGDGVKPGRRVVQLGDRLILGGMVEHLPGQCSPALACYTLTGERERSFNGNGQLILADAVTGNSCAMGPITFETNLALCSDGKAMGPLASTGRNQDFTQVNFDVAVRDDKIYVIATGRIGQQPRLSGFVFCVNGNGVLDNSFGDRGVVALSAANYSILLRSIVLTDACIYVAGGASGGHNPALVAKVSYQGRHDQQWGDIGRDGYGFSSQSFRINDVVVDKAGQLYGVGVGSQVRAIAVSFAEDGRQRSSFGCKGAYLPGLPYSALTYAQVDLQGRLVFIGEYVDERTGYLQATCGRLNEQGQPDGKFGENGLAPLDAFDSIGTNVIVQADGRITAVGYTRRKAPFACRLAG